MSKAPKTELDAGARGLTADQVKEDTKVATAYLYTPPRDYKDVPCATPIYMSAAWRVESAAHCDQLMIGNGYIYTRMANPTSDAAEAAINLLEGGAGAVLFASGQAAIYSALVAFLKAGDHVVSTYPMYLGAYQIIGAILSRFGIESTFVKPTVEEFRNAVKPNTRVFYAQSPTEHDYIDLEGLAQLATGLENVTTIVDSSGASPYCLKPIKYGIDMALHTATKYLGGHSDIIAGVVTARTPQIYNQLLVTKRLQGAILSPFDSFLLLRGVHTLHVRMTRHCDNADRVVAYLNSHSQVEKVYFPGLPNFNGHDAAKKQMNRYGSRVAFVVKGGKPAGQAFVENMRVMIVAISFGGINTICEHSASMGHGPARMTDEDRRKAQVEDGLVRMCVGLEDPEDIIKDCEHCLQKAKEAAVAAGTD